VSRAEYVESYSEKRHAFPSAKIFKILSGADHLATYSVGQEHVARAAVYVPE